MEAYYNGSYIPEEEISLNIQNRAFLYGDGFFETMSGFSGEVKWLPYHLDRIRSGLNALSIPIPNDLSPEICNPIIRRLFLDNAISGFAKVKLHAWRTNGGTYLPENEGCQLLVTIKKMEMPQAILKSQVSFSDKVKNCGLVISKYKSMSAQHYVLAALEMKSKKLDDIIITDINGNISECLVSNIYWVKDGVVFTPSLHTGCIGGVSRRVVMEEFKKRNMEVKEVEAGKEELLSADSVFTTNATGLAHILKIDNRVFGVYKEIEVVLVTPSKR